MATIRFILKSKKAPASIYVRLIDGVQIDISAKTTFVINPSDWSTKKQQPKNLNSTDFKVLNSDLTTFKSELLSHYNKSNGKVEINTRWLKDFIKPVETHGLPVDLIGYIDYFTKVKKGKVSDSTLKKYGTSKNKLARFQDHVKRTILIKEIDNKFQLDFEKYGRGENYAPNTIARDIGFVKTVCQHAKKNGLECHYQTDNLEIQYQKVESIYLTEKDIEKVKAASLSDSLDAVRDWLIISCFCGQRISDFLRFDKSMIRHEKKRGGGTVALIEFEQKKTHKIMTLPLHREILAILENRGGNFPPRISDQKYNEYIKKVCEIAEINELVRGNKKTETAPDSGVYRKEAGIFPKWELVTSHIGRRSFATNFYGKIPTALLITATGHSTEKMFLVYIGKSGSDRAKELSEYF